MIKKIKNNKILTIIILYVIICFSFKIYAYSSLSNYKPKYGTLTENVNFRSTASTSTGKIRVLNKGTVIKMVGNIDSFYIVQLGTNEVGVISKSYVKTNSTAPKGASTYTAVTISSKSTTGSINLRGGPGTNFKKITILSKGTSVKVVGYIGDWYVVVTNNNQIGCIRKDLLTTAKANSSNNNTNTSTSSFSMSANEKIVFDLINKERTNAGLPKLSANAPLFKIARLKAKDMVKNSYFSHTSPTYGSPFNMMKTYGISYKVAGENIAGNPSLEAAVKAWMNSSTHKQNILSNSYNLVGIGVEKSEIYGYVLVAMFVGR